MAIRFVAMPLPALEKQLLDGRYYLTKKLGEGAFGVVYEAQHLFLDEVIDTVAVKFLSPPTEEAKIRVLEEVRAMARLSHPHLLSFRSAGEVDLPSYRGDLFLVTELGSKTLEDELAQGLLDADAARKLARHIASALEYLAQGRCIHRDLKPANVLLVGESWKIADFGLARTLENSATHFSGVGGTPLYMAPECWRGVITPAVDVWALGAMLQVALCGRLPHERAKTQDEFIARVLKTAPFVAPDLPAPFQRIVAACLQTSPGSRPTPAQILSWLEPTSSAVSIPPAAASADEKDDENEIFVAPNGAGDFPSVQAALDSAPSGATIYLTPGTYRENLKLKGIVNLVAQPSYDARVTFEFGASNVLKIEGGAGTIEGIAFRGLANQENKRFYAANVQSGDWTFSRCDFESDSLSALHLSGDATVELHDCRFSSQKSDGILISGGQSCALLNCAGEANGRHGLHLKAPVQTAVQLEGCTFSGNGGNGLFLSEGALQIEKSSVCDNLKAGITLGEGADAAVRRCKIVGNGAQGIVAARTSKGHIEGCDLSQNRFGAYDVPRGCALQRLNNKE